MPHAGGQELLLLLGRSDEAYVMIRCGAELIVDLAMICYGDFLLEPEVDFDLWTPAELKSA